LAVCWLVSALIGIILIGADWLFGWNSVVLNWVLCIAAITATVIILYKYSKMHPDYKAVARTIEQQNPDMQALLLAAIEQQPRGLGGRLGYLQERVIGDALRHASKHNWLESMSSKKLWLAHVGQIAALLLIVAAISQLLPSAPSLFTINKGVLSSKDYNIHVTPGDTAVESGTAVVVMARFEDRVPPEAALWVGTSEQSKKRIILTKNLDDPVFGGLIPEVNRNLIYHIEYAGRRTVDFRINAFVHPSLQRADAEIVYPAYTKLPEKVIKNTRQISVVEGSRVTLTLTLNKPVTTARLVAEDKQALSLEADDARLNTYTASVTAGQSRRYELHLADAQGLTNKIPPRFTIDVHKNLPPELTPLFPNRDVVASPLEELSLEAEVSDDYGVTGYGLSYALAGTQSKDVTLSRSAAADEEPRIRHILALEDADAQPEQLLTYFFWADDIGPQGNIRRTTSDIYFAEIRHFDEVFRESQSAQQQNNQSQRQGGGQQDGQQLARLQKQIISATWNVKKQAEQSGGIKDHKEDLDVVRQSQADVLKQAKSSMVRAKDAAEARALQQAAGHMESSLEHLDRAGKSASTEELVPALTSEQLAYQELLKLKGLEHQVARGTGTGRGGNAGSAGSGRSQQQLQQLELTQKENRYETQRLAQSQQQRQREDLQVLNRLRELARRQKQMSERLKEAQAALQQAEDEKKRDEISRRLKRLREQQLEALRDIDELRERMERPQNRRRMAEARQQLDRSRSRINQSAEQMQQGMLSRAITSATRAQRRLERMREDFRRSAAGQFDEQMQKMREQARRLDEKQKEIAEDIKRQMSSERKTLADPGEKRELADLTNQQRESTEELIKQMKQVSEQAQISEPLLSRKLYDTLRKASTSNVDRALEATEELLKRNFLPQAQQIEKQARKGIEQIRRGVEEAAENVLGDEAESLRLAREQLDELIRQVDDEAARAASRNSRSSTDPNETPNALGGQARSSDTRSETEREPQPDQSAQQTRDGRASADNAARTNRPASPDPNTAARQRSPRGGSDRQTADARAGTRANQGGRANPRGWGGGQSGAWDRGDPNGPLTGRDFGRWSDRLRDVEEMITQREMREEAARIRDRARSIRAEFVRHGKEPQWDLVRRQISNPLTELRKHLSDKLAQLQSDEALVPIDRDPVPKRFAELVRKYYENLGEGG
jgi:hypothetical protein